MARITTGLVTLLILVALMPVDLEGGSRRRRKCCVPQPADCRCQAPATTLSTTYFCNAGVIMPGTPTTYYGNAYTSDSCSSPTLSTCTGGSCQTPVHNCTSANPPSTACTSINVMSLAGTTTKYHNDTTHHIVSPNARMQTPADNKDIDAQLNALRALGWNVDFDGYVDHTENNTSLKIRLLVISDQSKNPLPFGIEVSAAPVGSTTKLLKDKDCTYVTPQAGVGSDWSFIREVEYTPTTQQTKRQFTVITTRKPQ